MFELNNLLKFASFFILSILLLLNIITKYFHFKGSNKGGIDLTKPYPLIGHLFAFYHHKGDTLFQWFVGLIMSSPSATFVIHRPFGERVVMTGNPANVEHILKTQFNNYQKGPIFRNTLRDFLGDGILNVDGETWKLQRQVAIHEFNTKSLRKYIENVVDFELFHRLIPILTNAAKDGTILDFQDILQRFTFDNICKISFGYDPEYLSPCLPKRKFADALEDATMISTRRFRVLFPLVWKIRRFFNVGSEKRLKEAVLEVREFARSLIKQRKQSTTKPSTLETEDLLSRFLNCGHFEEENVIDIVIAFILGGRDTTSTALTWFFWVLHKNNLAEKEILKEIQNQKSTNNDDPSDQIGRSSFNEVKEMVYTHAALCESMRLYPPVPADTKQAETDDVLPGSGTPVRQGMRVSYFPYAMGRLESIWGPHWAEYRPERWLEEVEDEGCGGTKWRFVPRDGYSYPVFQAGARTCIGKEMAFLQMKRVVAGIMSKFKIIPIIKDGFEPVYVPNLTAKMEGGLLVRIEERVV